MSKKKRRNKKPGLPAIPPRPTLKEALPDNMTRAEYNALPQATNIEGGCVNCHIPDSKLHYIKIKGEDKTEPIFICEHCYNFKKVFILMRPHKDFVDD